MRPTRVPVLLAVVAATALVAWPVASRLYSALSPLPRLAVVSLLLLAVALAFSARLLSARMRGAPGTRPVHPLDVARTAALAKASSLAGAVVTGAYLGVAIAAARARPVLVVAGDDLVSALLGAAAGVALVLAALALERVCRVPHDPGG